MAAFTLRELAATEISRGLELCRIAGWNQLERDWRVFFDAPGAMKLAADCDGVVAGTLTTLPFGRELAWISMVLVDPAFRHRGIATALLEQAISRADAQCLRLDATPEGREVYRRLGFCDEFEIVRYAAPAREIAAALAVAGPGAQRAAGLDAPLRSLDREAFGVDRGWLLDRSIADYPAFAHFGSRGFCIGRRGFLATQAGPLTATDEDAAHELLARAVRAVAADGTETIVVDAPQVLTSWTDWLLSLGFVARRRFVRMRRGEGAVGRPEFQFLTMGPEFG